MMIPSLEDSNEELHDDLKDYVSEFSTNLKCLQHPLVYAVPYFGSGWENALFNKQYELKKQHREKAIRDNDVASYVYIHERPFRLQAFLEMRHPDCCVSKEDLMLLSEIWVDSENIWQHIDTWLEIFDIYDGVDFMTRAETNMLAQMFYTKDTITIYRGGDYDGLSHTTSKEKAEWFSKRYKATGKVIERQVSRDEIFAFKNTRHENEIILKCLKK